MLELSLRTSFTTFCSRGTHYGTSSAATLLVEDINSISLLEFQDNNSISGSAFKKFKKMKVKLKDRRRLLPKQLTIIFRGRIEYDIEI